MTTKVNDNKDFKLLLAEAKDGIIDVTLSPKAMTFYAECIRALNVGHTQQGKIDYAMQEKLESTFEYKDVKYKCTIRNAVFAK